MSFRRARSSEHVSRAKRRFGFSLLELLVVLLIVAVLFALGTPTYRGWQNRIVVQEVAVLLGRSIERARIDAKRTGANVTIAVNSANPNQFDLGDRVVVTDQRAEFTASGSVRFEPPFGVSPNNVETVFIVRSSRDATVERTVRVVGVLGKVVVE